MKERGRERERKGERWKGGRKRGEEGGRTEGSFSYRLHLPTYSPAIPRFQTGVIKCSQESVWPPKRQAMLYCSFHDSAEQSGKPRLGN